MKNKIILPIVLLFCSIIASSQTNEPKLAVMGVSSFGIYGGVNFQNLNGKNMSGDKLENKMIVKFHGGVNEQIPVAPDFYVQIGLQYIGKGTIGDVPYNTSTVSREINLHYIDLPINLLYKPILGTGHFLLGFGPYVGYTFAGKAKFSGSAYTASPDILFEKEINQSNPNDLVYYRHLDVGANAFFGYEFSNSINLVFNSQIGLIDINSKNAAYPNSKLSEMNTGFGLSLGYRF